jgi:hypothetical protein
MRKLIDLSPYSQIKEKLIERYLRKWTTLFSIIAGLVAGSYKIIEGVLLKRSIIDILFSTLISLFLYIFLLLIVSIGMQNIIQSWFEETFLHVGLEFLREKQFTIEQLQMIEKRSEIGSNASSGRTIIPIVLFTAFIPIIAISRLPQELYGNLLFVSVSIFLFFLIEVDKSNLDSIIQQVAIIYRIEQAMNTDENIKSKKRIPVKNEKK